MPGDFDGDFDIDAADLAAFADPTIAGWYLFDLDLDYDVDLRDFSAWQNNFCLTGCN